MKKLILTIIPALFLVFTTQAQSELLASNDGNTTHTKINKDANFEMDGMDIASYISNHFNYPTEANEANVSGKLKVQVLVLEDGRASLLGMNGLESESIKAELERMIAAMPEWQPAIKNGQPAKQVVQFSMNLQLD